MLFENFIFPFHLSRAIFCQSLLGASDSEKYRMEVTGDGHGQPGSPGLKDSFPFRKPPISGASVMQLSLCLLFRVCCWPGTWRGSHAQPHFFRPGCDRFHQVVPGQLTSILSTQPWVVTKRKGPKDRRQKLRGRGGGESKAISFMLLSLWCRKHA